MNTIYVSSLSQPTAHEASIWQADNGSLSRKCYLRGSLPFKKRKFQELKVQESGNFSAKTPVRDVVLGRRDLELTVNLRSMNLNNYLTPVNSSDLSSTHAGIDTCYSAGIENTCELSIAESVKRSKRLGAINKPPQGGCHGYTSRSTTFCKRQSGYKDSNYCKTHYQQQVSSETQSDDEEIHQSSTWETPTSPVPASSPSAGLHQDKRYTGQEDEVRCKATTTRGRDCSYIAVNSTPYCFLHSDYDTNPPPRRGTGGCKNTRKSIGKDSFEEDELPSNSDFPITEVAVTSPSSDQSDESTGAPCPFDDSNSSALQKALMINGKSINSSRRMTKLAKKHADSEYPLLSMISTNLWHGKTVRVATGPLVDHIGTVEKWGNGWVSISIPDVGMHNRRSFELYIISDGDDEIVEEEECSRGGANNAALFRCVSRDAVSPSPASMLNGVKSVTAVSDTSTCGSVSGKSGDWIAGLETPRPEGAVICSDQLQGKVQASGNRYVAEVTPCPKKHLARLELPFSEGILLSRDENSNDDTMTTSRQRSRLMIPSSSRYHDRSAMTIKRGRKISLTPDGGK
jgi:hypothetical protein